MHNFKVLKSQDQYRVCEHEYKLLFIGATIVKPHPMPNIPLKLYKFLCIISKVVGSIYFHCFICV